MWLYNIIQSKLGKRTIGHRTIELKVVMVEAECLSTDRKSRPSIDRQFAVRACTLQSFIALGKTMVCNDGFYTRWILNTSVSNKIYLRRRSYHSLVQLLFTDIIYSTSSSITIHYSILPRRRKANHMHTIICIHLLA